MTRDRAHQADVERRLSNLAKAPRCGERTRAGHPCRQAAVTGRARCRMHGGAKGSGGPRGDRNGNFKHGLWTFANVEMRKAVRRMIWEARALIRGVKDADEASNTAHGRSLTLVAGLRKDGVPPTFSPIDPRSTPAIQGLEIAIDGKAIVSGALTVHPTGSAHPGPAACLTGVRASHGSARNRGAAWAGGACAVRPDAWGRVSIFNHPPLGLGTFASGERITLQAQPESVFWQNEPKPKQKPLKRNQHEPLKRNQQKPADEDESQRRSVAAAPMARKGQHPDVDRTWKI